ncbi:MAG: HAMP domain-containing sensor histidine kinase, partial [Lachnospiraceae bacterium]|nr:HAMP domain-containing sensor histidine kinase [Lachnospiraceae bacterium]
MIDGWMFFCFLFGFMTLVLSVKLYLMKKSLREIKEALSERLDNDTNTLLGCSVRDGDVRALADSLNVSLRRLRRQRHIYQQGNLELKEAVTNISHDLRTPLTAISGYLQLLEQEEKSQEAVRYLDIIGNRMEALKQLTEELFRYTIVTCATQDEEEEPVVLNHMLEESLSAYYAVIKGAGITPQVHMTEQKVERRLNRNALSRIFGNVISNAVKYSDGDLDISLSQEGEICFSNHAGHLDKVKTAQLFDRFYTVENARSSTGLGLSIARMLTEQMGGRISADYEEGILKIKICF